MVILNPGKGVAKRSTFKKLQCENNYYAFSRKQVSLKKCLDMYLSNN